MTKSPIVIDEYTSIMKANQLMKENGIRRIPVVKNNKIVGIVSDRDIKEAAPSKATSLDVHELYYLLSEIKIKDIMTSNPITIKDIDSVEKAAVIMLENKISGLPVIDSESNVIGMITQTDVFKVMISITGIYRGPIQVAVELEDKHGETPDMLNKIRAFGARLVSVLTSYEHVTPGRKEVYVRLRDMDDESIAKLSEELKKCYKVLYINKDVLAEIPKRVKQ
jgi:acetoin utilization protein AcuB